MGRRKSTLYGSARNESNRMVKRFFRMTGLLVSGKITAKSWRNAMHKEVVAVRLVEGGMVFCDADTEQQYFQ
jgi:hypothetical protein